jgi:hypothetical protein
MEGFLMFTRRQFSRRLAALIGGTHLSSALTVFLPQSEDLSSLTLQELEALRGLKNFHNYFRVNHGYRRLSFIEYLARHDIETLVEMATKKIKQKDSHKVIEATHRKPESNLER